MMDSIILHGTDVKDTGWQFDLSVRSPFLKIGTILAFFQSAVRVPVSNDCWIIIDSGFVTAAAHSLSNMGWM